MDLLNYNSKRRGMTGIELIIVISILLITSLIATPTVLDSNRRAAVNAAGEALEQAWSEARQYAIKDNANLTASLQKYYGIAIYADGNDSPTGQPVVQVIKSNGTGTPEVLNEYTLSSNNSVLITPIDATASEVIEVYAQYRTGLPISAASVRNNEGSYALPISLGTQSSPLCSRFYIHTIDYDIADTSTPSDERSGYIRQFQIYEVSIACLTDAY